MDNADVCQTSVRTLTATAAACGQLPPLAFGPADDRGLIRQYSLTIPSPSQKVHVSVWYTGDDRPVQIGGRGVIPSAARFVAKFAKAHQLNLSGFEIDFASTDWSHKRGFNLSAAKLKAVAMALAEAFEIPLKAKDLNDLIFDTEETCDGLLMQPAFFLPQSNRILGRPLPALPAFYFALFDAIEPDLPEPEVTGFTPNYSWDLVEAHEEIRARIVDGAICRDPIPVLAAAALSYELHQQVVPLEHFEKAARLAHDMHGYLVGSPFHTTFMICYPDAPDGFENAAKAMYAGMKEGFHGYLVEKMA